MPERDDRKKNGIAEFTWELPKSNDPERSNEVDRISLGKLTNWLAELTAGTHPLYVDDLVVNTEHIYVKLTSNRIR